MESQALARCNVAGTVGYCHHHVGVAKWTLMTLLVGVTSNVKQKVDGMFRWFAGYAC